MTEEQLSTVLKIDHTKQAAVGWVTGEKMFFGPS